MNKLLPIALLALTVSCTQQPKIANAPINPAVSGYLSVVQLTGDSTSVVLTDYFPTPEIVDSVQVGCGLAHRLSADKTTLTLLAVGNQLPPLSVMSVWIKGDCYNLLMRRGRKLNVHYEFNPAGKRYKVVQLAGQINDWNPKATTLSFDGKVYSANLSLNPGKYHYQLVLDGKWQIDPANPMKEDNGQGAFNSVLLVGNQQPEKMPHIVATGFANGRISIESRNNIDSVLVMWQNSLLSGDFVKLQDGRISVAIPSNASSFERSHIRVFAYNQYGEANDLLIPLEGNKPVMQTAQLKRTDKHSQIMYFLMVDRFNNGDTSNDRKVDDPEINPKANYFGGDIAGVAQKIDDGYFKSLGVNTIWLSPITQNPLGAWGLYPNPRTKFSGYHGYWPITLTTVDFRFGTGGEFTALVDLAHRSNMNVLLDYVANHVHQEHPLYKQHPDWATNLYLPDGTLNTERWDEHRLTTWFDVFLPTLDLERQEVYEPLTDSALFWLTSYGIDGFRHDATKHIHENFWRRLTQKIKLAIPERSVYQIGETYGSKELIASYIGSGMLDSQFDFNIYDASVAAFGRSDVPFEQLNTNLHETFSYYGWNHLMGNISGNQDRPRFISLAGGSLRFDEDAKLAGWTREIGVGDTAAYSKLCMLMAFNMTIPGVPTIYYGDEYGVPGANDPDNRRMAKFGDYTPNEQRTLEAVKKLTAIRNQNMALIYGDFNVLAISSTSYAYLRTYMRNSVLTAFNKSNLEQAISVEIPTYVDVSKLKAEFGNSFTIEGGKLTINLKPTAFEIITLKQN